MDVAERTAQPVPTGFCEMLVPPDTFNMMIGPLYCLPDRAAPVLGFRIEKRHCNPAGIAHGGMMMSFADMAAGFCAAVEHDLRDFMPTVNMTFDFISPGQVGDWVEGRSEVHRITRSLVFCSVPCTVDGKVILRASAILKRGAQGGRMFDRTKMLGPPAP